MNIFKVRFGYGVENGIGDGIGEGLGRKEVGEVFLFVFIGNDDQDVGNEDGRQWEGGDVIWRGGNLEGGLFFVMLLLLDFGKVYEGVSYFGSQIDRGEE